MLSRSVSFYKHVNVLLDGSCKRTQSISLANIALVCNYRPITRGVLDLIIRRCVL